MKLVQRTSNTLTMRYVPWGAWLMASYLIVKVSLMVAVAVIIFPNQVVFTCTRSVQQPTQGQCQLSGFNLLASGPRYWALDQITAATLLTTRDAKNRTVYEIALTTKQEQVAVPLSSTKIDDIQHRVSKIQEFLANPVQTHLTVKSGSDSLWSNLLLGSLPVVLGGILIYLIGVAARITTLRLNKITGTLALQHRSLFKTETVEYSLKDVADVVVIRGKYHRAAILLSKEQQAPSNMSLLAKLMWVRSNLLYLHPMFGLSLRRRECKRCAQQIRDFLDLPSKPQ